MRVTSISIVLSGLLASVHAAPNADKLFDLINRAACNRDNCLRQVVASSAAPGPAKGSADCLSFFSRTVCLCPSTVTVTASTSTSTATNTATTTSTVTVSIVTPIVTSTTTATQTATQTATVTAQAPNKRTVVPVCTPVTTTNTAIPIYASSCKSPSQYSSACSCDGVSTPSPTTITPSAISTTTTPTTVVTVTSLVTVTTSVTATTVPITTVATSTVTTTTTTTTTLPATPTACSAAQRSACSPDRCGIELESGQPHCYLGGTCVGPGNICLSNQDCYGRSLVDHVCVTDDDHGCENDGTNLCVF